MEPRLTRKDLMRKPYRGIYSEIARERGVTPQAIVIAVWETKNVKIRDMVLQKIRERRHQEAQRLEQEAIFESVVSPE
jgi:predicted transcriptional regulator